MDTSTRQLPFQLFAERADLRVLTQFDAEELATAAQRAAEIAASLPRPSSDSCWWDLGGTLDE